VTKVHYSVRWRSGLGRPPLWATLATLAGLAVFVMLGTWQLERAAEKADLLAQATRAGGVRPIVDVLPEPNAPPETWLFRRVILTGEYETQRQVLLDNMPHGGRVGHQVLTPLRLSDGRLVLVNRGWLVSQGPRGLLPDVSVAPGPRRVEGRLNQLPRPGLRLGGNEPGSVDDPWPRLFLYPERKTLEAAYGEPLPTYQLQLAPDQPDGFVRRWETVNMPPERHLGYAVQWFAFALVLLIIYFMLGVRRGKRHNGEAHNGS
jgi:surfeit locus 1 family protein